MAHMQKAAAKSKSRSVDPESAATTSAAPTADTVVVVGGGGGGKNKPVSEQIWLRYELRESIANFLAQMGITRQLLDSQPHLKHFDSIHQSVRSLCHLCNIKIVSPESAETLDETLLASPPQMVVSPVLVTAAEPHRSRLRRTTADAVNSPTSPAARPTHRSDGTRRSAFNYVSSPETEDLSSSRSPSLERIKPSSQRGKRSSAAQEIPAAKKSRVADEAGEHANIKVNIVARDFSPVVAVQPTSKAALADAAKTPVAAASGSKSVESTAKKSAKIMTRMRAAKQNAIKAAAAAASQSLQAAGAQRGQQTPLSSSLLSNRMVLPNSITKKYHKLQTKKLQKENKNATAANATKASEKSGKSGKRTARSSVEEAEKSVEAVQVAPSLSSVHGSGTEPARTANSRTKATSASVEDVARESLEVTPSMSSIHGSSNQSIRVTITPVSDSDRELYQHAAQVQPVVSLTRLSEEEVRNAGRHRDTATAAAATPKINKTYAKKTNASPASGKNKSSNENERDGPAGKQANTKATSNVLRVKNAAAGELAATPLQSRTGACTSAAAADETYCDYPVTPFQPKKLHDVDNYDVSELHDSDSEDDEEDDEAAAARSKKPIPSWAREPRLTNHMIALAPLRHSLHRLFQNCRAEVDLKAIFNSKKQFMPRSSSANWDQSPLRDTTSKSKRPL